MKACFALTLVLSSVFGCALPQARGQTGQESQAIAFASFQSRVGNIEYAALSLVGGPPPFAGRVPEIAGEAWYGTIMRRLPDDPLQNDRHYVAFAVEYVAGQARRAWYDKNLDGDLTNDPEATLFAYPDLDRAKSFLADLAWTVEYRRRLHSIQWKIRVVLESLADGRARPFYRIQRVYAPMGTVSLEGRDHRAFLFDGNWDGLYTRDPMDGIFVDVDDDLHFEVDPLGPEFGSFRHRVEWGGRAYEVHPIDPGGGSVAVTSLGEGRRGWTARTGERVPDVALEATDGRRYRLSDYKERAVVLYFWASWCGACRRQARELVDLYSRFSRESLEILGVSYDSDVADMQRFMHEHGETWPSSFSGGIPSDDPIGRMFQESGAGVLYLIDPEGYLAGVYYEVGPLSAAITNRIGNQVRDTAQK